MLWSFRHLHLALGSHSHYAKDLHLALGSHSHYAKDLQLTRKPNSSSKADENAPFNLIHNLHLVQQERLCVGTRIL